MLLAAHFGFVDCIKYLLSTSKDDERQLGECTKDRQYNILHLCAEQARQVMTSSNTDHAEICQYILEHPTFKHVANRLLYGQDIKGNTPLHLACRRSNIRMCELFVKYMESNTYLFVKDSKHRTPLHICATFGSSALLTVLLPDTVDRMISTEALDNIRDISGKTPLHLACAEGECHRRMPHRYRNSGLS